MKKILGLSVGLGLSALAVWHWAYAANPAVAVSFYPTSIAANASSLLKITLNNPNPTQATLKADFVVTLPSGLVLTNADFDGTCAGIPRGVVGGNTIVYPKDSLLPGNGGCTIETDVTSGTAGSYVLNINANALQTSEGNSSAAVNASVSVQAPPMDFGGEKNM